MTPKTTKTILWSVTMLGLSLACFFRFSGLTGQGLIFYDEAAMAFRSGELAHILTWSRQTASLHHYADTKVLWLTVIAVAQGLFPHQPAAIHLFSALCGLITVGLTFVLCRQLFRQSDAALTSAAFLALSSYHVFYSRLALPESLGTLLVTASLCCYLAGTKRKGPWSAGAGICAGLAFLALRFRAGLLPVMILVAEGLLPENPDKPAPVNVRVSRFLKFLLFWMATLSLYEIILWMIRVKTGMAFPSFFWSLTQSSKIHRATTDLSSWLTYPFYIYKFDGPGQFFLLISSVFFLKKKPSMRLPLALVFIQVLASTLVAEKSARSISIILPLLSIIYAVTLFHIFHFMKRRPLAVTLTVFLAVISLSGGLIKCQAVRHSRSQLASAFEWVEKTAPGHGILTANIFFAKLYAPQNPSHLFDVNSLADLRDAVVHGYDILVLDPQKFIKKAALEKKHGPQEIYFNQTIENVCRPQKTFDHFDQSLLERFLLEHTRPDLKSTLAVINNPGPQPGAVKVYDLRQCLSVLERPTPSTDNPPSYATVPFYQ